MTRTFFTLLLVTTFLIYPSYSSTNENEIKSGIIYYISKNVKWPEQKQKGDFVITIVGSSDITGYLKKMAQTKKIGTRNIVVKTVSSPKNISDTHVVFLPEAEYGNFNVAKYQAENLNGLLITEKSGLAQRGSAINFVEVDGRITYEVNESSFDRANLKISSRLLTMANN